MNQPRRFGALTALVLVAATSSGALAQDRPTPRDPIILDRSGGFVIGGRIQINPNNPNRSLSCDHGYVEYFLAGKPAQDEPRHVGQLEHAGVAEPLGWWRRL